MAARTPAKLTPKVRDLVATDRLSRPPVGRLTPAQVEQLLGVVAGKQRYDVEVSAARALGAIARGARAEVAVPALAAVLADGRAPRTERIAAARGLGVVGTADAEQALLAQVRVRDPRVQQDVFAALGEFAGAAAADALSRLSPPTDRASRKQLAFTRALIAHRHGLDAPFMTEVRAIERRSGRAGDVAALTLRLATATATAARRSRLRGPAYGITFADRALSLTCGPAEWTVFLNQAMGRSTAASPSLLDRPWIAAVLAQALPKREALTTRLVLLTRPAGTSAHVDIARADGEIVYTGSASPDGSAVRFTISDVERPGTAPLTLAGRVLASRVDVDTAVAFAARAGGRETLPAVAP